MFRLTVKRSSNASKLAKNVSKYSRKVPADAHNGTIRKFFHEGLTDKQMAKKLNVTITYIQNARRSMRLLRVRGAKPHIWTQEQDSYLSQAFGLVPLADMAIHLKVSPSVVRDRLHTLNIGTISWDDIDDAYIQEVVKEAAEKLEKTPVQIVNRAVLLVRNDSKNNR